MFLVLSYHCTLILLSLADVAALLNTNNLFIYLFIYYENRTQSTDKN